MVHTGSARLGVMALGLALFVLSFDARPHTQACDGMIGNSLRVMTINTGMTVARPPNPNNPADDVFIQENEERAATIAKRILAHDPDVVVLNEVLDSDAADAFVAELHSRYPSYVEKIDDSWDSLLQDSGLMLFSKYPFMRFSNEQGDPPESVETLGRAWVVVDGEEQDDTEPFLHQVIFEYRESGDHWAEKGAGLIRFQQRCAANTYTVAVAFTHTQGGYLDEGADFHVQNWARVKNLAAVKWLIEDGLTPSQRTSDWLILAGDLNVNGNPDTFHEPPYWPYKEQIYKSGIDFGEGEIGSSYDSGAEGRPHSQWQHVFDNIGAKWEADDKELHSFYSRGSSPNGAPTYDPSAKSGGLLIDAWAFETSPRDVGVTNSGQTYGGPWLNQGPGKGERLDYITHNKPADANAQLCMQYIFRAVDFASGPFGYLTDHGPVLADFNLAAPRCSITRAGGNGQFSAEPVTFDLDDTKDLIKSYDGFTTAYCHGPTKDDLECAAAPFESKGEDTRLTFGGSMQWYKIDSKPTGQPMSMEIAIQREICGPGANVTSCVTMALYHESDLSTEIAPFEGKCKQEPVDERTEDWKCKYLLEKPPYYVRVFFSTHATDHELARPVDGQKYAIALRRFACRNKDDACFLPKHLEITQRWPKAVLEPNPKDCDTDGDGQVSTTEDGECRNTMWFRFTHENPGLMSKSPEFVWSSTHDSFAEAGADPVKGTIVDAADFAAVPLTSLDTTADGTTIVRRAATDNWNALPGLIVNGSDVWERPYYLKLTRYGVDPADPARYLNITFNTRVVFKTQLTYHTPTALVCIEERTDVGEDDVWQRIGPGECHPNGTNCFRWGSFDSPDNEGGTSVGSPRQYALYHKFGVEGASLTLWEDVDDDEAYGLSRLGTSCDGCGVVNFDAKSWEIPDDDVPGAPKVHTLIYSDRFDTDDQEYRYRYSFVRSKKRASCTGKGSGPFGVGPACPSPLTCSNQGYCCVAENGVCKDY
jgi:hypothetical protein